MELSDTQLAPIFAERLKDLKKANPQLSGTAQEEEIVKISLAAQRFLKANNYKEASHGSVGLLNNILQEVGLSHTERYEVSLLAGCFLDDLAFGTIDKAGQVLKPEELEDGSVVMQTPHKNQKTNTAIESNKALHELGEKLAYLSGSKKNGAELSDTELSPILAERLEDLKKVNPEFREPGQDEEVVKVSLAAQRFLKANDYKEPDEQSESVLNNICQEMGFKRAERSEVRLVVGAFVDDLSKGVIDKGGNILKPGELAEGSLVMQMPHKDKDTQTSLDSQQAIKDLGEKLRALERARGERQ